MQFPYLYRMNSSRRIMNTKHFGLTIQRLCHQLIERYDDFSDACLVGIQARGVWLSERLAVELEKLGVENIQKGKLDITFYRDDFKIRDKPLSAHSTEMDFLVEGKQVVLIDDVLYTGRTIQAALTALNHYGRPDNVALLTLVDRRFNRHLPIQPDFVGIAVDALDEAYVQVQHIEKYDRDQILLFDKKIK